MEQQKNISVILLAGGLGTRMNSQVPKQYLQLESKPVVRYSFDVFIAMPEVMELIVVCEPNYQHVFSGDSNGIPIRFASPGNRRQDSVYHGFQLADPNAQLICIHDGVRPFITPIMIRQALQAAQTVGAAALAMPIKFTVKECCENNMVKRTLQRSCIWEIQTPQVIQSPLLTLGFKKAIETGVTVTDDVSLIELIPHPVQLVKGSHHNIKITTPEDLELARWICLHTK
jgi:2-C-methyl-D-erythritol 4-phosphate cytidylyltransferase